MNLRYIEAADDLFDVEHNPALEQLYAGILQQIPGEDSEREGIIKTPKRAAAAMQFLTQGYEQDPAELIKSALFEADEFQDMVIVRDIEFYSLCEHHILPFYGRCHVAYIPSGKIVGLSKIPRLVEVYARRLQVQERLTHQVAQTLNDVLQPRGVAAVMEAQHMCMMVRGVEKQHSRTVTSAVFGEFHEDRGTRAELMDLLQMHSG